MKAVGVKALKARLSEYLRQVKGGETVLVTEREEVIAELRPAMRQKVGSVELVEELQARADRGEITLRSEDSKTWPALKKIKVDLPSQQVLDALREE